MLEPPLPPDEAMRLAALRSLNILDTPAEERFDRITRLAQRLFDVPIALVSLVDTNRQWFKSCQGLDASETPRSISFCGHAILEDGPLIIEDATKDQRFADNPLVTGPPDIRFYTGQPLKKLTEDMERDKFFKAKESLEYGLIDRVLEARDPRVNRPLAGQPTAHAGSDCGSRLAACAVSSRSARL